MLLKQLLERLRWLITLEKGFQVHDEVRIKGTKEILVIYGTCKSTMGNEDTFAYDVVDSKGIWNQVLGKDLQKVRRRGCRKCR